MSRELFDLDLLENEDPFEIDAQATHLFKRPHLGLQDVYDVWTSDPLFYPAKPPAHWLMCAEVAGRVLAVPLAPRPERGSPPLPARRLLPGSPEPCTPVPEGPMNTPLTPEEEYDFYAQPENQEPQGPSRRRRPPRLTEVVPVRFPAALLEEIRRRADADDRSLSAWIRRAVEHELRRSA